MKRWPVILFALLLLAGCSDSQTSSQYVGDTSGDSSSSASGSTDPDYDKFNIFSYEELGDRKWKITNNSDDIISDVSFHLTYYDADNVIVDSAACSPDTAILPGQSAILEFYAEEDYPYSCITSYIYDLPEDSDIDGRIVSVDVIAEDYEIIT